MPKISFVIPAFNEEKSIALCLGSILKEIEKNKCSAEIILVNNNSSDNTKKIASGFAGVSVVDEPHQGLVWARKAGLNSSTGDLIANIDADNILPENYLKKVFNYFEQNPDIVALSGPLVYYDLGLLDRVMTKIFYFFGFVIDRFNYYFFNMASNLQGGNFIVKRSAMEQIGFDTSIDFYGEDTDVGRRLNKIGKVKWTFKLPIYSSGRRMRKEGIFKVGLKYSMNFFYITFAGKPFSKHHKDIR